jgi:hypothetical protein
MNNVLSLINSSLMKHDEHKCIEYMIECLSNDDNKFSLEYKNYLREIPSDGDLSS